MKRLFGILFLSGAFYFLNADEPKSITIENVGDMDYQWEIIVINTYMDGPKVYFRSDGYFTLYLYFIVQDSLFNEIINLINSNMELFSEQGIGRGFGIFKLDIKYEKTEYQLYLNERETSVIFFNILLEMIKSIDNTNKLVYKLESVIIEIGG